MKTIDEADYVIVGSGIAGGVVDRVFVDVASLGAVGGRSATIGIALGVQALALSLLIDAIVPDAVGVLVVVTHCITTSAAEHLQLAFNGAVAGLWLDRRRRRSFIWCTRIEGCTRVWRCSRISRVFK